MTGLHKILKKCCWYTRDRIPKIPRIPNMAPVGKKTSTRFRKYLLPRQARHLAKTPCRCPKDFLNANLKNNFVRRLEYTFARYIVVSYKRRLNDILLIYLEHAFKLSVGVSKMSYRRWLADFFQKMSCMKCP